MSLNLNWEKTKTKVFESFFNEIVKNFVTSLLKTIRNCEIISIAQVGLILGFAFCYYHFIALLLIGKIPTLFRIYHKNKSNIQFVLASLCILAMFWFSTPHENPPSLTNSLVRTENETPKTIESGRKVEP